MHRPDVLKALRGANTQDGRAMRLMLLLPPRGGNTGGELGKLPEGGLGTRSTYREIGNNGFRVICPKREGETFQER